MTAAIALSRRGWGQTALNPSVGCVVVDAQDRVVGRGWTQKGGRPHAEAMALAQAGARAQGGTAYVTLEPCFHHSERGPRCSDLLIEAGLSRVVIAVEDPDPRTAGKGANALRTVGIAVDMGLMADEARTAMSGFFTRLSLGRPHVTLKLGLSLDGCIAMADGRSRWITGERSRAHAHVERACHDAIMVGRGTFETDIPVLTVRLDGLEHRSPRRLVLGHGVRPDGWTLLQSPDEIRALTDVDRLLVEGGARTASSFLKADMVDRLLLYRAPIFIGGGKPALQDIGLESLADAHGRWRALDARQLGPDRLEVYERVRAL